MLRHATLVLIGTLALSGRSAAQHLAWEKIDAQGNVVLDLSEERNLDAVWEANGWIVLRYGEIEPHAYRLLEPDGTPYPGEFEEVRFSDLSTSARKADGELRVFDLDRRDLTAPLTEAGLQVRQDLGEGRVVAESEDGFGVYGLDGALQVALEDSDVGRIELRYRGVVERLNDVEREQGWTILSLNGKFGVRFVLISPNGVRITDEAESYRFDGEILVVERPWLRCYDSQGTQLLDSVDVTHAPARVALREAMTEEERARDRRLASPTYIGAGRMIVETTGGPRWGGYVWRIYDVHTVEPIAAFDRYLPRGELARFKGVFENGLAVCPDLETGLFGALDPDGQVVIPFEYGALESFREPITRANKDGETFYIDTTNQRVAPPDGLPPPVLRVEEVDRHHFVTKRTGHIVTDVVRLSPPVVPQLPFTVRNRNVPILSAKDGDRMYYSRVLVKADTPWFAVWVGPQAGIVSRSGAIGIDPHEPGWSEAWIDVDQTVLVSDGKGKIAAVYSYPEGFEDALYAKFPGLKIWRYLGDSYVLASLDTEQQFILSPDGETRIDLPEGAEVGRYGTAQLCPVRSPESGRWGAIDRNGEQVLSPEYDTLIVTRDGDLLATRDGEAFFVDGQGQSTGQPPSPTGDAPTEVVCLNDYAHEADQRFVLARDGEPVTREYSNISGLPGVNLLRVEDCGALGLLDRLGREIVPASYDHTAAGVHLDGHGFVVSRDGRLRLFGGDGQELPTAPMQAIAYLGQGRIHSWQDDQHVVAGLDGDVLFALPGHPRTAPDVVGVFDNGRCSVRSSQGEYLWGEIDEAGQLVTPFRESPPAEVETVFDPDLRGGGYDVVASSRASNGAVIDVVTWASQDSASTPYRIRRAGRLPLSAERTILSFSEVKLLDGSDVAAVEVDGRAGLVSLEGPWLVDPDEQEYTEAWIDPEGLAAIVDARGRLTLFAADRSDATAALIEKHPDLTPRRYLGRGYVSASLGDGETRYIASLDGTDRIELGEFTPRRTGDLGRASREGYFPVRQRESGRWGAIDSAGQLRIPCEYESLITTTDGSLLATLGGQSVVLDSDNQRTAVQFAPEDAAEPAEPVCLNPSAFTADQRWVLKRGDRTVSREYETIQEPERGAFLLVTVGPLQGVLDRTGSEVLPLRGDYERIGVAEDGRAWSVDGTGRLVVLDAIGVDLAAEITDRAHGYLGDGLAHTEANGEHVIVTLSGYSIFTIGRQAASDTDCVDKFSEGLCAVRSPSGSKSWGAINTRGALVIPHQYDSRFTFRDGLADVTIGERVEQLALDDFIRTPQNALVEGTPPTEEAQDAETPPRVVRLDREGRFSWSGYYVLEAGGKRSGVYEEIDIAPDRGLAAVRNGARAGLIDFEGRELIEPDGRYTDLDVGDPWITAEMTGETVLRQRRKVYGFIDDTGETRIGFHYARPAEFRGGHAWVARAIRNPDLEAFRQKEEWFTDNRTVFREGDGNGRSTLSVKTSGEYARVLSGKFENGRLNDPIGSAFDPRYGRLIGKFEDGQLVENLYFWTLDGRELHGRLDENWRLQGQGHSYRRDGTLEFVGEWRDGRKWTGTGYIKDNETHREDWLNGVNRGLREVGWAFRPPKKPTPPPEPGTRTMTCNNCNGIGKVYARATYEWVPDTSLILAGSKYYGTRYTHYEYETGRYEEVSPDGYFDCGSCGGTGHVWY